MAELFAAEVIAQAGPPMALSSPMAATQFCVWAWSSQGKYWKMLDVYNSRERAERHGRSLPAYWSHFVVVEVNLPGV